VAVASRAVNVTTWNGSAVPTPNAAGTPLVEVSHWRTDPVPSPNVAGVPLVDVTHFGGAAVASAGIPGTVRRVQAINTSADFTALNETAISVPATLHDTAKTYIPMVWAFHASGLSVLRVRIINTTSFGVTGNNDRTGVVITTFIVEIW
jgi:hypothetical protein